MTPDERRSLAALMPISFVDMIGFSMLLPLIPFYAEEFGASYWVIGVLIGTYALAELMTAPFWGRASDHLGRRRLILVGISVSAGAYVLFGFASSVLVLFVSRFVQGVGGGKVSAVQAYVADSVRPEVRAQAIGWHTAATSAGVIIGPAVGSWMAGIDRSAPGLFAAALCLTNAWAAWKWLPESKQSRATKKNAVLPACLRVVTHPLHPVCTPIIVYALGMMAFMAMNAMMALYLGQRFGVTETTIWPFYTYVASITMLCRLFVIGPIVRRLGEIRTLRLGAALLALGYLLIPLSFDVWSFAAAVLWIPVGTALLFPTTTALVSRRVDEQEVGATLGVQQAYGGVARLVGPLWSGLAFQQLGVDAPMWIAAAVMLLGFMVSFTIHRGNGQDSILEPIPS